MKKTLTLSAALLALLSAGSFALADDDDRPHFARGEDEACSASDRDGGFRFWSRECESEHDDDDDDYDDDDHGRTWQAPQPSTPPANGLFSGGVPQVQTN